MEVLHQPIDDDEILSLAGPATDDEEQIQRTVLATLATAETNEETVRSLATFRLQLAHLKPQGVLRLQALTNELLGISPVKPNHGNPDAQEGATAANTGAVFVSGEEHEPPGDADAAGTAGHDPAAEATQHRAQDDAQDDDAPPVMAGIAATLSGPADSAVPLATLPLARAGVRGRDGGEPEARAGTCAAGPAIVHVHCGARADGADDGADTASEGEAKNAATARVQALLRGPSASGLDLDTLPLLARALQEPAVKVINYRGDVLPVFPLLPPGEVAVNPYDNSSARVRDLRRLSEQRVARDGLPRCSCAERASGGAAGAESAGQGDAADAADAATAATAAAPRGDVVSRAIARVCQCGDVEVHRARLFRDLNEDPGAGAGVASAVRESHLDAGRVLAAGRVGSATLFAETTSFHTDGRVGGLAGAARVEQAGLRAAAVPASVARWGLHAHGRVSIAGEVLPAGAPATTLTAARPARADAGASADVGDGVGVGAAAAEGATADAALPYCVEHREQRVHLWPTLSLRAPLSSLVSVAAVAVGACAYALFYPVMVAFAGVTVHNILWGFVAMYGALGAVYWLSSEGHYALAALLVALVGGYIAGLRDISRFKDPLRGTIWHGLQAHWCWRLCHAWGRVQAVRLAKLDPAKQYLFAVYPHGILIHSRLVLWGGAFHALFPALRVPVILAARVLFAIPGSRELCDWLGAVDAGRKTADASMSAGLNVAVYPGGTAEILTTDAEDTRTTLLVRSGFVRLAMRHGVPIVPTVAIGEKYMYARVRFPSWVAKLAYRKLRAPLVWFHGAFYSWLPDRRPLTVIFGRPIPVRRREAPSEAEVAEVLAEYLQQCVDMFHAFKGNLGYGPEQTLNVVDANAYTHVRPVEA